MEIIFQNVWVFASTGAKYIFKGVSCATYMHTEFMIICTEKMYVEVLNFYDEYCSFVQVYLNNKMSCFVRIFTIMLNTHFICVQIFMRNIGLQGIPEGHLKRGLVFLSK